jgi:hypothetical protein
LVWKALDMKGDCPHGLVAGEDSLGEDSGGTFGLMLASGPTLNSSKKPERRIGRPENNMK